MRWIVAIAFGLLIGCGSQDKQDKQEGGADAFDAAQAMLDGVAGRHDGLTRLTLHAVPAGKDALTQVASTMESRRGKPSDPEDLQAMKDGKEIVLDEEGAVDVTVPILMKDGKPTAIAGVTLELAEGADRDALVNEARTIAKELEAGIQKAGKPLW